MTIKSILKPEGSIGAGIATVALVYGIYQLDAGNVATVGATTAYDPVNSSSIKKAGYTSIVLVSALTLIARDPNIAALGFATVIAMQAHYRHANAVNPGTGQMVPPAASSYQPAIAAVPMSQQGQPVSVAS